MVPLATAAGGWDRVPSDQIAQIHKDEMVLPANLAEGARNTFAAVAGGAERGGPSGGGDTHLHFNALDPKSLLKYFSKPANQAALMRGLSGALRTGRTA